MTPSLPLKRASELPAVDRPTCSIAHGVGSSILETVSTAISGRAVVPVPTVSGMLGVSKAEIGVKTRPAPVKSIQ